MESASSRTALFAAASRGVVRLGTETGWVLGGFDRAQPAMFCWTGVAPYLTAQAIESGLRTIAAAAPGSEVVFSYRAEDCALDDVGTEFARIYTPIAASVGEPLQPGWPVS